MVKLILKGEFQSLWYCSLQENIFAPSVFLFAFNITHDFFPCSCEAASLTAQKYNQTLIHKAYEGSKMIFSVCDLVFCKPEALFGSPNESGCSVLCSLMPF